MASNYNCFTRPVVVLCCDGRDEVLVERETLADLVAHDRIPAHLAGRSRPPIVVPSRGEPVRIDGRCNDALTAQPG